MNTSGYYKSFWQAVIRMRKFFICAIALTFLASIPLESSYAAKKKKKKNRGTIVQAGDTFSFTTTIGKGKKAKEYTITCLDKTAGSTKVKKNGSTYFTPYKKQLNKLKKKKKTKTKKYKKLKKLKKAGKGCKSSSDLTNFKGAFTAERAARLYERFAWGGRPDEINEAVARGLDWTIAKLTTPVAEPFIEQYVAELECDGRPPTDPDNEACDPRARNDRYTPGIRYGLYYRIIYSANPFFEKMWHFLHDERMAVSTSAVSGSRERWAAKSHEQMLRRAAYGGDMIQYSREWNSDFAGNLKWLDGAVNKVTSPNENYAREFWELLTMGPVNLDGSPAYTFGDIVQAALAHSGWKEVTDFEFDSEGNKHYFDTGAFAPELANSTPRVIFAGTKYQASVINAEDVLRATFAHPRASEYLAEDIWREFINPNPTPSGIRALAKIVRESNFNLIVVMRRVMSSKAVLGDVNKNTLLKHPTEILLGFLRKFYFPMKYSTIDHILDEWGQRPLLPDTVFGWDTDKLAAERYVLPRRNEKVDHIGNRGSSLKEDDGYDLFTYFLAGLPQNIAASQATVDRLVSPQYFNVELNDAQKAGLVQYLDYDYRECKSWEANDKGCTAGQNFLDRNAFDANPDADFQEKLQGLKMILMQLPQYQVK